MYHFNPMNKEHDTSSILNFITNLSIRMRNFLALGLALLFFLPLQAQKRNKKKQSSTTTTTQQYNSKLYEAMEWRSIGPYRGGRSVAVAGVPNQPNLYYFGGTGGGVWKTENGGRNWENISDGFFGGSIGAIAVSEYDPNVIYVGGGETPIRGNVSFGYGVWKSVDAGATWENVGLNKSRHIGRIRIHPRNPDIVYVAALGNIFAPHEERGVYKSMDGGKTWSKTLYVNDEVGAVDLTFDPNNSRIMYASTWRASRNAYSMSSGGEGSGLWKSTDSGATWTNISSNEGLPDDTIGIIGVAVSPLNSNRIWALIESQKGGLFRSDDAGKTWKKINDERSLRQRAWYYTRIYADTEDEDVLYVMNVRYHKSKDGGKTFKHSNAPHGDHHDLWIAPEDSKRMVIADDGGGQVTYDGGETWSTYHNQPTAQFYRVTTDNAFPYRIYAAQQDNSTIRINHRSSGGSIGDRDWEPTAGGESGHIAIDPTNNDIVYGGSYDGFMIRKDHANNLTRAINVWPDNPMGHGAEGMKYRFQWNYPIFFSPHNPKKLYTASNHLHVSYNEGQTWEIISPDLTRNDPSKLVSSGGPITQDNTSVEYYCTIFAALESPRVKDLIWAGSDDGLLHVTKDGGKNWAEVTPTGMPKWTMINSIEADPFNDGGLYVAATYYKGGDFRPYLYKTKDYGQTWTKIVNGIDAEHFTRVVRADPARKGLLYAGTETGMYVSFDDGANWQRFQLNLPIVPITDLAIKNNNLIAATQGRSLWVIDDLTPLHQMSKEIEKEEVVLFKPMDSYRMGGFYNKKVKNAGINHPNGVMVYYYIKDEVSEKDTVELSFHDANGKLIKTISTHSKEKKDKMEAKQGSNLYVWNMRYPEGEKFEGLIMWSGSLNGPKAVPGNYKTKLSVNGKEKEADFKILKDERSPSSQEDMQKQFDFLQGVIAKVSETHRAIKDIRDIRAQMKAYTDRINKDDDSMKPLFDAAAAIDSSMTVVEKALYQTQNRSRQDPLNFPIRLNNKLAHLNSLSGFGDYPPTDQTVAVQKELTAKIDEQLAEFYRIKREELPKFNEMVKAKAIDAIILDIKP